MADAAHSETDQATAASVTGRGYRVLARKYRPTNFDDLIGQEAMVRTVSNAFDSGRIPQAWILTGVRGVGKTTTARILARALNYELPDGSAKGPSIQMPSLGLHCQAIMESRHIDVLEMDAASHTGIDDVRQITDGVRYAPSSARYKVYIIDEVHMLSEKAFNAFLKTLEEPPEHAKFVFATTEIRKVPVTVLSRCQRFDLRRVDADVLMTHLGNIATKEQVEIEPEALAVIARAAEGSVRDSLSLLDQAIAHAAGTVRAGDVRQMLGLADRTRVIELFDALARGDIASAFKEFRDQYDTGADPVVVLSDLAEFVNFITRIKVVPATADNLALGETERLRGRDFATKLSMRVLSRMWQMLLKGIAEVQSATRPQAAAEMVLVRIAYVSDLPTPDEAIRMIEPNGAAASGGIGGSSGSRSASALTTASAASNGIQTSSLGSSQSMPSRASSPMAPRAMSSGVQANAEPSVRPEAPASDAQAVPVINLRNFEEVVAFVAKRDIQLQKTLERDVRFVRMEDGQLEIALENHAPRGLPHELQRKLEQWTGRRWMVAVSNAEGEPTLRAQRELVRTGRERVAAADPRVQEVLSKFPGAQIIEIRHTPAAQVSTSESEDGAEPFENDSDD